MNKLFALFVVLCVAHLGEHIAQVVQIYALKWPVHEAGGILGYYCPWLAHSEVLHYVYARAMWSGLWFFRHRFTGTARSCWMVAYHIQTWHHFEHALLLAQAIVGQNLFDAPQPISVIQLTGFLKGTAESGFGGLLGMKHFGLCNCPGARPGTVHTFEWLLLTVRRPEVHAMYNVLVTVPMGMTIPFSFSRKP